MSLQTRLATLINQIGADIKDILARLTELESPTPIDGGRPDTTPSSTIDAGVIL